MLGKLGIVAAAAMALLAVVTATPQSAPAGTTMCTHCVDLCTLPNNDPGVTRQGPMGPHAGPDGSCNEWCNGGNDCSGASLDEKLRAREVGELLERTVLGDDGAAVALLNVYSEDVIFDDGVMLAAAPCSDGAIMAARIELTGSQLAAVERRQQLALK